MRKSAKLRDMDPKGTKKGKAKVKKPKVKKAKLSGSGLSALTSLMPK